MNIAVIGAGYVGLVTSACLAYLGNKVTAVDSNSEKIANLNEGRSPFFEPGLDQFLTQTIEQGNLNFTSDLQNAVKTADVVFIAVGTPPLANGESDLSQVMAVAREIGRCLDSTKKRIIVNKSTVPVGSGNWVEMLVNQGMLTLVPVGARSTAKAELPKFAVVSNPEFLREGSAIADSFYPDRIVVGASDNESAELMRKLYDPILNQSFTAPAFAQRPANFTDVPFIVTDLPSAELIKYAANAFRL